MYEVNIQSYQLKVAKNIYNVD